MTNYIITVINNEQRTENIENIVNYLGKDKCVSICYNYLQEYKSERNNNSFNDYCNLSINKKNKFYI